MARLTFLLFTAGLLLIERTASHPLNKTGKDSGTEVNSRQHALFLGIGDKMFNSEMELCNTFRENEQLALNALQYFSKVMTALLSDQCKNVSMATLSVKGAVTNHFNLEGDVVTFVMPPIEKLLDLLCSYVNGDNVPMEEVISKVITFNLNLGPTFEEPFSKLRTLLKQFFADFQRYAFKKQSKESSEESQEVEKKLRDRHLDFSKQIVDLYSKLCSFEHSNEVQVKEIYMTFFHELFAATNSQCRPGAMRNTTRALEILKQKNWSPKATNLAEMIYTHFDVFLRHWCLIINDANTPLEQTLKMVQRYTNKKTLVQILATYMDAFKSLLFD